MNPIIDFRSDTLTQPTEGMLKAMFSASVGDDVFGEDPTVNKLEETVAELLGKEAALFVPSGTMGNQLAIHLHTRPGQSVIAEEDAHVYLYEGGASAALSGIQYDLIPFAQKLSDESIRALYKAKSLHSAATSLLTIENTHNRGDGRILHPDELARITACARSLGLSTHCDGARVWNAAAELDVPERDLVRDFDSVSVCFSKGLGAPVGSALASTREFIAEARRIRKRWGGAMRQCGYLAAAALYALQNHRSRLKLDHENIRSLAKGFRELLEQHKISGSAVTPEPNSNILYLRFTQPFARRFSEELGRVGVKALALDEHRLRFVTHLHISSKQVEETIQRVNSKNVLRKVACWEDSLGKEEG